MSHEFLDHVEKSDSPHRGNTEYKNLPPSLPRAVRACGGPSPAGSGGGGEGHYPGDTP
jgi:hypothetical protein